MRTSLSIIVLSAKGVKVATMKGKTAPASNPKTTGPGTHGARW